MSVVSRLLLLPVRLLVAVPRLLLRRYRTLTVMMVILATSLLSAFSTGFWLPFRIAYIIMLGVPLAYLWARLSLWGLRAEVARRADRLEQGQYLDERITLRNRSLLGKLWLEVEDSSDIPNTATRRVISLGPGQSRSWRLLTPCNRRGLFTVGPLVVTSGDPFGIFRISKQFGRSQSLLVYPKPEHLGSLEIPSADLLGTGHVHRLTHYITPDAISVRQYAYGDSYNRIHWPSTARTRDLMVKLFEMDPDSEVWLLIDLDKAVHAGEGDNSTEEYAVAIAAAVARYFSRAGQPIGLLSFGRSLKIDPPQRGIGQYVRILESLALMRADGEIPLADLLDKEGRRFGRNSTLLVITPSNDERWVSGLQSVCGRGARLAVALIEPDTFGGEGKSLIVFGTLTAAGIQTYLLRRGDGVAAALSGDAPAEALAVRKGWQ